MEIRVQEKEGENSQNRVGDPPLQQQVHLNLDKELCSVFLVEDGDTGGENVHQCFRKT